MSNSKISHLYMIALSIMPILMIYGVNIIVRVTFTDIILLLFLSYTFIKHKTINSRIEFLPIALYLVIQPVIIHFYQSNDFDIVDTYGTSLRLALIILCLNVLSPYYLERDYYIKCIRIVAIFNAIYAGAQFVSGNLFSWALTPYIPFLPVVDVGLDVQQQSWIHYGILVRGRGLFREPSHLAIYLLLYIMAEQLYTDNTRSRNACIAIALVGLMVSGSSMGLVGIVLFEILKAMMGSDLITFKITKKTITSIASVIVIGAIWFNSGYLQNVISHLNNNGNGILSQSHLVDIQKAFKGDWTLLDTIFGRGLQQVSSGYLPGWPRALYCLGISGIIMYIYAFGNIYVKSDFRKKVILLVFCLLNFGTEIMLGIFLLLYLSLIFSRCNYSIKLQNTTSA